MRKPESGFLGFARGREFATRQSRGTGLHKVSFSANRNVKNFCDSRFVKIRAVFSFISIKSGASPWVQ